MELCQEEIVNRWSLCIDKAVEHRSRRVNGLLDWCSCMNGTSGKNHDPAEDDECLLNNKEDMEIIASAFERCDSEKKEKTRPKIKRNC
nr:hypothetical protein MarFTME_432 [Marseillevirus futianmevirus]